MNSMEKRRSIRKYKPDKIERSVIEEIVKAGILAPSAKNRQPWKYIVYTGASKEHLLDAMERGLVREKSGKALLPESAFGLPIPASHMMTGRIYWYRKPACRCSCTWCAG